MDKLRDILEQVRKYHFWVLCVVAVAAGLVGWMMARGSLSNEYQKKKGTIISKFGALDQIQNTEFPPNDSWKAEIDKLTEVERKKVADAWKAVYEAQQKVLEWPEVLGDAFKNEVIRWLALARTQPDAEMSEAWRGNYRDRVSNMEFPKLLEIVDAEPSFQEDGKAAPATPPPADQPERQYRVIWAGDSQKTVQKSLQMDSDVVPKSFAVWLKLEDLWVYRALLKVIRATNEGSGFTSRIKGIDTLLIGVEAGLKFKEGTAQGHIEYAEAPPNSDEARPMQSVNPAEAANKPLDDGRYVDNNGEPLPGAGLQQTTQYKQMPVYMRLVMDQREIPRFLTHCANSPLPVEVKQLRINPGKDDGSSKKSDVPVKNDQDAGPSFTAPDPFDVIVDIHGIIYIYNPPDPTKLGETPGGPGTGGA